MTTALKEIEAKALTLSAAERELLANHLFESVHGGSLSTIDEAWLTLAEERYESLQNGSDAGMTEAAFFDALKKA